MRTDITTKQLMKHSLPAMSIGSYLIDESFLSAFGEVERRMVADGTYVVFTAYLFQRGSAQSRDPDEMPARVECSSVRCGFAEGIGDHSSSLAHRKRFSRRAVICSLMF